MKWLAGALILLLGMSAPRAAHGKLTLPQGFSYSIYADGLSGVRWLAFGPDGALYASQLTGKVMRLAGLTKDGKAEERSVRLSGLDLPHGLAFRGTDLYVAEAGRLARYAAGASAPHVLATYPSAGMHVTRTIGFGPEGLLYLSIGSDCNVCEEADWRRAAILTMPAAGAPLALYAKGLRNAVGFCWTPDGKMWATENGRDHLGDSLPPDEVNLIVVGGDYGWPYAYGNRRPDPAFPGRDVSRTLAPAIELPAHVAPLGIAAGTSVRFPERYRGGLFVCEHGSWNRSSPIGYQVVYIPLPGGKPGAAVPFATGFLESGRAWARPVCPVFGPDGALFVSDDSGGRIFRITFR